MVKKCICLLLAFVMTVGILSGCIRTDDRNLNAQPSTTIPTVATPTTTQSTPQTTTTVPPTTALTQPEDPGIELEAQAYFVMETDSSAKNEKWPKIINSAEELETFANSDYGKTVNPIAEAVNHYNDAFFEENSLILLCMYYVSYYERAWFCVESCIKKDGDYLIELGPDGPLLGPSSNRYVILFIEVKDDIPQNSVIHFELLDALAWNEIVN